MARGVELILKRQLGRVSDSRVENQCAWLSNQESRGVSSSVTRDEPAGRIGRAPVKAKGAKRRPVQQRRVVEVQNEHGRVRSCLVDFVQRRHPAFGKLELV